MEQKFNFTIGGVEFSLSKGEVEQRLRDVDPEIVREVSVEVNGRRYPVKQALADATGLLRGNFTSHDAMRVFRKLSLPLATGPMDASTFPERFYTSIKSLNEFDQQEVRGVIGGLLKRTDRDNCFTGIYYRGKANIESLLALKRVKDFQAITMLARSMFELATDMRLIDVIPDAVRKIIAFSDVEKLRAARRIVEFRTANSQTSPIHAEFIKNNAARIEAAQRAVWPTVKNKVAHWSGLDLRARAMRLKAPFDEIYDVQYAELSWFTHSAGLTGFDLKSEAFPMLAGRSFALAAQCYVILLTGVIDEFKLTKADPRIKDHLKYAQVVPFTQSDQEEDALHRRLMR